MQPIVILILAACGIVASRYYFDDYFAPLGLFCIGWLIPLGVSELSLSSMQEPLDNLTWVLVVGSTVTYLAGLAIVSMVYKRPKHKPVLLGVEASLSARRLQVAMVALLVLAVIAYAYEAYLAGGIPIMASVENRTTAYRNFPIAFVHYATVSAIPAAVLAVLHFRLFGRSDWKLPAIILLLASLLIFSMLARQELLLIVVASLMVVAYTARKPITATPLLAGMMALLLFFVLIGRGRGGTSEFAAQLSGTYLPSWASGFVWPYLYLAVNFTVLQFLTHANLSSTLGAHTLQPILSLTLTRRYFPLPNVEEEFGWFNTFTYLWPLYSDFRVVGTLFIPTIYGAFTGWYYFRFRNNPTPSRVLIYTLIAFTTLFFFQSNGFSFAPYYVFAFEFWLAIKYASLQEPLASRS